MSNSETGNMKYAANFGLLVINVKSLGNAYNPSQPEIQISSLTALKDAIESSITDVTDSEQVYKSAINARIAAFKTLSPLTTRIKNALIASKPSEKEIKDVSSIAKKVMGQRIKPLKNTVLTMQSNSNTENMVVAQTTESEINTHSVSQMGYDNRIGNFVKLITNVSGIAKYNPNEDDLKTTSLTAFAKSLQPLNESVHIAFGTYYNARTKRDKLLFAAETGARDILQQVKSYVKSVFGPKSAEYKLISKISISSSKKF